MHENLKFTLKLDEKISKFDKFKGKDPNSKEDRAEISDWQAIYASNQYGTHFLIYAKFIGKKENSIFKVETIQLYLQNYSGPVTIGFVPHASIEEIPIKDEDPDIDPRFEKRKKYFLQVSLKAVCRKQPTYSFNPKTSIELSDNSIIMTSPIYVPANPNLTKIFDPENRKDSLFVDEMFMERMGSNIIISEIGKTRLLELYYLNEGFVTKENLKDAGIDVDLNSTQQFTDSPFSNYELNIASARTPRYPCIPIYAICEIK
ncbi:hypothetical protein [uncultured Maribacter sp.]|uniref:hypothetical protein n=1 Tax=uncultured Maribacter sp. TaxID=431308 RepID=UPI0030EB4654|tara:strand:+ start:313 stop:1092 length:780 start_codon:yes stop_codon:yes gene_type:complete